MPLQPSPIPMKHQLLRRPRPVVIILCLRAVPPRRQQRPQRTRRPLPALRPSPRLRHRARSSSRRPTTLPARLWWWKRRLTLDRGQPRRQHGRRWRRAAARARDWPRFSLALAKKRKCRQWTRASSTGSSTGPTTILRTSLSWRELTGMRCGCVCGSVCHVFPRGVPCVSGR